MTESNHITAKLAGLRMALPALAVLAVLLIPNHAAAAADPALPPEIEKLLALPEDKIDIGLAALTFAHDAFPGTDVQAYSAQIDKIVAEVRQLQADGKAQHLPGLTSGPDDTILALNAVLYDREGFKYDHSSNRDSNALNQYLPGILQRKLGICTTMPMLYMALAQRLGLTAYTVESPLHNFVRIIEDGVVIRDMEATSGTVSSDNWYIKLQHINSVAVKRGTYMRTITHHQYLAMLLGINGVLFDGQGNTAKAMIYLRRAEEVDPQSAIPVLDLMEYYRDKTLKLQDDYIYALKDSDGQDAAKYLKLAISYRRKLQDMGINMEDYVSGQDKAAGAAEKNQ